ncbi:hypothetical protein Scep_018843 [Stephania cephalantha]|uniref:Uncharacterized protein n=1 Tax=Stephania cephalantha TaxID=152367 RepID=A0AAP0NM96_9MAGN
MPSDRANLLTQALDEAFELLYYIDQKTNIKDAEDELKHELAKIILENNKDVVNISGYDNAMLSVDDEYEFFRYSKPAKFEMDIIKKFLQDYDSRRIHAMYKDLEEAFICSLYDFLYRLPDAVIKEVEESPIEEHEERARVVAKLVCKYKLLDDVLDYGLRMTPWES